MVGERRPEEVALALTGMGASHLVFVGPRVAYLLLPSVTQGLGGRSGV